ncbi:MAG: helix-turn-helix transcriptional regulator [Lachnospiraceae bacterium]|nr:helix-turn-helix transcriptional regulator [Lachnospiraceae bacterium]
MVCSLFDCPFVVLCYTNGRIQEIRENSSLTQQKIADLLHIGQRTYADYESGKTRIPVDNLLILVRFYNVSIDYITGANNIKSEYPKA